MYSIGDKVWYAARRGREATMTCPDCFGKKYLTVILGDDSKVTIDCTACARGYEPSRGYITYTTYDAIPELVEIGRIETNGIKTEYGFSQCRIADSSCFFATEEEAKEKAEQLCAEHEKEEIDKINSKQYRTRTWAWNATYHRKELKRTRELALYHEYKLNVAMSRVKVVL